MALLFDWDAKTIRKHVNNVFSEGELEFESNTLLSFYEVGTSSDSNAKSLSNRLYINRDTHMIVGKTVYMDKEEYYTVIAIRKNIGQTY